MKYRYLILIVTISLLSSLNIYSQRELSGKLTGTEKTELKKELFPSKFSHAIDQIQYDILGNTKGVCKVEVINDNVVHVTIAFTNDSIIRQDDWQLNITPAFTPSFNWSPHLTPTNNHIIDQHVFRSPALILTNKEEMIALIPDLDIMQKGTPVRWYLDMDAKKNILTLGMSNSKVIDHVLFQREQGAIYPVGTVETGFYLMHYDDEATLKNPFRRALEFLWSRWGKKLYDEGNPIKGNLEPYIKHTYNWAFNTWKEQVWQEFDINGRTVGSPTFIVNVTQSPNFSGEVNEREFRSVWNQAWFSSLRSASGLFRYARRTNNKDLLRKANLTKELALTFPKKEGFFYGIIATEMTEIEVDGNKYNRSKGWTNYYWGNSNRNPYTWNPKESPFHLLDMSWTALLMLRWYDELEKDQRLIDYAEDYAKALLKIQYPEGFFPAWLEVETLGPKEHLNQSSETSMSVSFLLKLFELTNKEEYKLSALRAINAVMKNIIPVGKWEDFETYWSCSRYGSDHLIGKKEERNNMYKQNNFSIFWTTEALLAAYQVTGEIKYLEAGRRTLDEMLMTQASWQPPFMYVNVLGGFGVLNADGEWNDSRQSLFAEIILQYGKILNIPEYNERGMAALKASFVMMYCPENPITKKQWEKVYPFFGPEDYGFTMENYGHGGRTSPDGEGMGEFTIYDWGNGAAAEAYNRIIDKFGKIE